MSGASFLGDVAAAQLYDSRTRGFTEDLAPIARLAGTGALLEVGCGTGRVLRHLSNQGLRRIVGVECDAAKLAITRQGLASPAGADISFIHGDFLTAAISERFDRVLFAFNVFAEFLTVEARIAALERARGLLANGGQVIMFNALHDFAGYAQAEVVHRRRITAGLEHWELTLTCRRNAVSQISHCQLDYWQPARDLHVYDRYSNALLTRNELFATFSAAHLACRVEYGSYALQPLSDESLIMIHVLEAGGI